MAALAAEVRALREVVMRLVERRGKTAKARGARGALREAELARWADETLASSVLTPGQVIALRRKAQQWRQR
jgi:hypothetical protein